MYFEARKRGGGGEGDEEMRQFLLSGQGMESTRTQPENITLQCYLLLML